MSQGLNCAHGIAASLSLQKYITKIPDNSNSTDVCMWHHRPTFRGFCTLRLFEMRGYATEKGVCHKISPTESQDDAQSNLSDPLSKVDHASRALLSS